jgi:hypothetical protein
MTETWFIACSAGLYLHTSQSYHAWLAVYWPSTSSSRVGRSIDGLGMHLLLSRIAFKWSGATGAALLAKESVFLCSA